MTAEDTVGAAAAIFFVIGGFVLLVSVIRGRRVSDAFAARYPERYEEAGRPRPGFWDSERRRAWSRFLAQRDFERIPDPTLVEGFSQARRIELYLVVYLIVGFACFGLAALWLEVFRPDAPVPDVEELGRGASLAPFMRAGVAASVAGRR